MSLIIREHNLTESEIPCTRIAKIRKNNYIKYGQECTSNWISHTLLESTSMETVAISYKQTYSYHMTQQSNP